MKKCRCLMAWDDILDPTLNTRCMRKIKQDYIKIKNLWSTESNAKKIKTELHMMGKDIFIGISDKECLFNMHTCFKLNEENE